MWRLLILLLLLSSSIQAQNVGINTTGNAPNSSAMLDVESADKGLLIPRVSLTDIADVVTIPTPALSLLVYNTNAAITGGSGLGYYYFDGTNWIKLIDGSTANTNWSIIGNAAIHKTLLIKAIRIADYIFCKCNHVCHIKIPFPLWRIRHQLPHAQCVGEVLCVMLFPSLNQLCSQVNLPSKTAHQKSV